MKKIDTIKRPVLLVIALIKFNVIEDVISTEYSSKNILEKYSDPWSIVI